MRRSGKSADSEPVTLREYQYLCIDSKGRGGYVEIEESTFEDLEEFIKRNRKDDDGSLDELLALTYRKGIGDCIQARNYVGVIAMRDGTTIQILPKVSLADTSEEDDDARDEGLFLKMLQAVFRIPMRSSGQAALKLHHMGIFEAFISMYLVEADRLVKQGLRSDYVPIEENANCLKGRLLFTKNVRANAAHKERFYVCHDEYSLDRPENRIIKATLLLLGRVSNSEANRNAVKAILPAFAEVNSPKNVDADLSLAKSRSDRNMSAYERLLIWSAIFLKGESFSTFHGREVSMALLFPMETLFECYVASSLRQYMRKNYRGYSVKTQAASKYLFDTPKKGLLRPDIVCSKGEERTVVLDTKWKRLNSESSISQADLYQMYAYSKKYQTKETVLVYPATSAMQDKSPHYDADDDVHVKVFMYDLTNEGDSLEELSKIIIGRDY